MSQSKPSGSNKRTTTDEHRQFEENWELQYFCSEINNNILCSICKSVVSVGTTLSDIMNNMSLNTTSMKGY